MEGNEVVCSILREKGRMDNGRFSEQTSRYRNFELRAILTKLLFGQCRTKHGVDTTVRAYLRQKSRAKQSFLDRIPQVSQNILVLGPQMFQV